MKDFKRGLSAECATALRRLAEGAGDNWWKDVLASEKLLLAVRGGYLNAYAKGQSVFKIGPEVDGTSPRALTHYKYLIEPEIPQGRAYVQFDGENFAINPAQIVQTHYQAGETLNRLIKNAMRFSGLEKDGVD